MKNKVSMPPALARRFLLMFLRQELQDEVEGDLEEKYYSDVKTKSQFKAKFNYWYEVFNYLRPFAIRKSRKLKLTTMYKSYFRIGWRNLLKQKMYSLINVGGLSIGLACFILILLYVQYEFSYDKFFKNEDRIYRIYQRQVGNVSMGSDYSAVTPLRLASVMEDEFPEIEFATSVSEQTALISFNDQNYWEPGLWADSHFLDIFNLDFIQGNATTALSDPTSIILTKSFADKLFPDQNPLGRTIKHRNETLCTVTGVVQDLPTNSSFQFSYITNILSNERYRDELNQATWSNNSMHTFFLLRENNIGKNLETKFPAILEKYRDPVAYKNYPFKDEYIVQPIAAMHLTTGINSDFGLKGNKQYIYLFSIVAIIVLLLACVNYMNLAIARSIKRAKEVGLRKVVGAMKSQVMGQFLGESVLIALVSLLVAIGLTFLLLPFFSNLVNRQMELDFLSNSWLIPCLFILVIFVGLFSGSYPAFVMSRLMPVQVLKGKIEGKLSGIKLQSVLIVVQYAVSIIMVIGSLVIYKQIKFTQNIDLGYNKENILTISLRDRDLFQKNETLKTEWLKQSGILGITISSHLPTSITSSHIINDEDGSGPEDDVAIYECRVDADFVTTYGIQMAAGRNFLPGTKETDQSAYLINETAAKALGWTPIDAIGKTILDNGRDQTIVGVVKDFHLQSLHLPIAPLILSNSSAWVNYISVKIQPEKFQETIAYLDKSLKSISPYPIQYIMLDDKYDQLYKAEIKMGEVFGFFTTLAILIASIGIFGLAAFSIEQRTKEIGIRKVLGASVSRISFLLTKNFITLVGIAFIMAVPVSWYAMNQWLQGFAYRINIGWSVFAIAGMLAFVIATLAIGYQSIKAARSNPIDSLKSE